MVAANFLYENANSGAANRQGDNEWEEIDPGKNGVCREDGLEVKREVVGGADEDKAVAVTDAKCGHVSSLVEKSGWHKRIFRDFPLDDEEEHNRDGSEDDQAEGIGAVPWMGDTTGLKPEKEHDDSSDNGQNAEPVDGLYAGEEWRSRCLDLQEKDQQEECSTIKWEIDINLTKS